MSMKKIFTLALAACSVLAVSAKELQKVDHSAMKLEKAKMVSDLTKRNMFTKGEARTLAAGGEADTVFYGLPMYAFHQGYNPQGYTYYGSYIIASVDDSLVFYNASAQHNGYVYGWYVNGVNPYDGSTNPYIADSLVFWTPTDGIEEDGYYYVPELLNSEGGTYQFGSADEDGTLIWASPASYVGMTSADVDDESFAAYSWSSNTDYFMGTGMFYGSDTLDTYVTFIGAPNATTTVDTISLFFWTHNLTGPFANQTAGLSMVLFDENGNNIGAYKATAKDIAWSQAGGIMVGQLNFAITASFHGEAQCYLTGFNNPGVSIGCMTDDNPLNGNHWSCPATYIVYKNRLVSFGNNIGVFFNAKFGGTTDVENHTEAVKVSKQLKDGKIVIVKGSKSYNVLGAEL